MFKKTKKNNAVVKNLEEGKVDIVEFDNKIWLHICMSKKIRYKNIWR